MSEGDQFRQNTLTLYVGEACHLCDQARQLVLPVVEAAGWALEEVTITNDPALMGAYGIRIPVVKTSKGAEKGWPFTAGQLKRLINDFDGFPKKSD